jgi:glycosyltransferase involved in cell wall biosynthesis
MELARWLPALGEDVDLTVLWPGHVLHPAIGPEMRVSFVTANAQTPLARIYHEPGRIRALLRGDGADVVHYPANFVPLLTKSGGAKVVLTVHDLSFLREPAWYRWNRATYYRYAIRRSVRLADRLIADSYATATDLSTLLKVPQERIDAVPLGVGEPFKSTSADQQATVRQFYSLPEQFFLYVGTIEPRKNIVRLIEAWSKIAAALPYDLVIAGREGWKCGAVKDATKISPHASRIHFPGFIRPEDLPALLGAARVFVWPSLWEGFGLPPLEALACGTPVVSSNRSSIPEALGDSALLVDPLNVEQLAAAMRDAATDEALRKRLVAAGLGRAATFSWRRTAQLTAAAYRRAVEK